VAITFFSRRLSLAAEIRARQIAPFVGGKLNPTEGYEDDVCICVKAFPQRLRYDRGVLTTPVRALYFDIVDDWRAIGYLVRERKMPVLVTSESAYQFLARLIAPSRLTILPQQHCNFERRRRTRAQVTTVGAIGEWRTFAPYYEGFKQALEAHGFAFEMCADYKTREDVVAFYERIDLQLAWRMPLPPEIGLLKNPMKLANAGSFGIPTVGLSEKPCLLEFKDAYWPVAEEAEAVAALVQLRDDPGRYADWAARASERAEAYHVSRIVERYQALGAS
jgi:hypothetical protein